ncbi:MAG TPA: hypothetical protein VFC07_04005 [Verrucomicrobiae bacterium]|nr:hypothetical protein [Verrucomicrobiae bacterium]
MSIVGNIYNQVEEHLPLNSLEAPKLIALIYSIYLGFEVGEDYLASEVIDQERFQLSFNERYAFRIKFRIEFYWRFALIPTRRVEIFIHNFNRSFSLLLVDYVHFVAFCSQAPKDAEWLAQRRKALSSRNAPGWLLSAGSAFAAGGLGVFGSSDDFFPAMWGKFREDCGNGQ